MLRKLSAAPQPVRPDHFGPQGGFGPVRSSPHMKTHLTGTFVLALASIGMGEVPALMDRLGIWEITAYKARIRAEDLPNGCTCLTGTLDKHNEILGEIESATRKPLAACTQDKALMAKNGELIQEFIKRD
ncbi:hypothetical protein [Bordetella trematum]|uniref:hypothetical protein n=1 Tax=Bordetella trematum TaxID=123899 RepID=UPI0013FDF0D7|nr:hypothetical protein [Bordetella trematum]